MWRTTIVLAYVLLLSFPRSATPQATVGATVLRAPDGKLGDAFGRSVAISGESIVVGADGDDTRGVDAGAAYVYMRDPAGAWKLEQTLLANEGRPGDRFGWSVDVQGDFAVVGAPGHEALSPMTPAAGTGGAVYVFTRSHGAWTQVQRLQPADLRPGDGFGWSIAIDGDSLLVGAPNRDSPDLVYGQDGGAVWVYRRDASGWRQEDIWTGGYQTYLGRAVDVDDAVAVTNVRGSRCPGVGPLVRWAHPAFDWFCSTHVPPYLDSQGELFGYAVAIRGSHIAAGHPRASVTAERSGQGWSYHWDELSVTKPLDTVRLVPTGALAFGRYGSAVAITAAGDLVLGPANGCTWVWWTCGDDTAGRPEGSTIAPIRLFRRLGDAWAERAVLPIDPSIVPRSGYGARLATDGRWLVTGAPEQDPTPQNPVLGPGRAFVYDLDTLDSDGDGMLDDWEDRFGLNPTDAADAALDPDGDGATNHDEFIHYTHPRNNPGFTRYFAEGATSDLFETRFAFANPNDVAATVAVRFLGTRSTSGTTLTVPPRASRKLVLPLDAYLGQAEFSTVIESDQLVAVDRLMTWSRAERFGAHGERAIEAPSLNWYLAEGATHSGFNLFYLLQNPNAAAAQVRVRFLRPSGAPLEKTYTLPPNSRNNVWVNHEDFPGLGKALSATDVSAVLESTNGQPIIVERALYLDLPGQVFGAGHESAGVTAPATQWFMAEGFTGAYFDLFVLIANPGDTAAEVEATYLLPSGTTVTKAHTVAATGRFSIWVDNEDAQLADTAVSTTIRSTNGVPVIVERALWWPGGYGQWYEAHNSPGATTTGTKWVLAEGEVGGAQGVETYILLANTSSAPGSVKVTLLFEDGTNVEQTFDVTGNSRFNVDVRTVFAAARNMRFGALVESLGATPAQIVVERAMYWNALGQRWAAGTNALATKLQ